MQSEKLSDDIVENEFMSRLFRGKQQLPFSNFLTFCYLRKHLSHFVTKEATKRELINTRKKLACVNGK